MWLTFFGLATANACRILGARIDPRSVVYLCLLVVAANFLAALAKLLGSRTAFYVGLCGVIVGGFAMLTTSLGPLNAEHRRPRDAGTALVRDAISGGVAIGLGALAGICCGYAWDRAKTLKR
ncbi:MAG TPA: hypothetical protein VJ783_28235 [Pirellulales bacterium]|nr:hypothetical protein [Pirellulales bacterium]